MSSYQRARKMAGLKQIEAALTLGVTKDHLSRIERGEKRPSLTLVERMATVYGLKSLDELVGRVPQDAA